MYSPWGRKESDMTEQLSLSPGQGIWQLILKKPKLSHEFQESVFKGKVTGRGRKGGRPLARHAPHVRGAPGAKPFVDDLLLGLIKKKK